MFFPLRVHNPARNLAFVTYGLILLNGLAYLATTYFSELGTSWVFAGYGLVPRRFAVDPAGEIWVLFSSMFLHKNLVHLLSNLVFLHVFGADLEALMGRLRYLAFFLGSGLCAVLVQVATAPNSAIPMVGASGAIAGLVGAYLVVYPRAPVLSLNTVPLLWFVLPLLPVVPAWWIAGEYFVVDAYQALEGLSAAGASEVGVFAHLGGFIAGLLMVLPLRARAGQSPLAWTSFKRASLAVAEGEARWKRTRQLGK